MKRLTISTITIVFAAGVLWSGATGAFFSDTETSTNNMFTAGQIDLKIDNESYYNGNVCLFLDEQATSSPGFYWQGSAQYPVPGSPCDTSFPLADLDDGLLFFNFNDLKPDDEGEDTISIHVQNDAWACMDVSLTSNNDISSNEPELGDGDAQEVENNNWDGELAQTLEMFWWADDGDNVYEEGENGLIDAPMTLMDLATTSGSFSVALADAENNVWGDEGDPIPADDEVYIAKAWCFGTLEEAAIGQDGEGKLPGSTNGPMVRGTGFNCDGEGLDNTTQTDGATVDVAFEAVQARHNDEFLCEPEPEPTTLTLMKTVVNDNLGQADDGDFTLSADGPSDISGVEGNASVTNAVVLPGAYDLSEVGPIGYAASDWVCVGGTQNDGNTVTIAEGQQVTCTITNDDIPTQACTAPTLAYADNVISSSQGVRKNGTAINADRTDPNDVLGAPQSTGTPFDNPVVAGSFFSLGFKNAGATPGGEVVVEYTNNIIVDGPGNDIRVWEVTGGTSYPVEKVKIEVSQDGANWFEVTSSVDRDAEADLADSGLTWAKYIRVTDVSPIGPFEATADGYDLDAISALNCAEFLID